MTRARLAVAAAILILGASGTGHAAPDTKADALAAAAAVKAAAPKPAPPKAGAAAAAKPQQGAAPTQSDLAYGAFQRGLYLTALQIARPLGNLGDPAAQTLLGEIYSRGLGVPTDLKEAARWYRAAAVAGSAEGQFRYAMLLLDGTVVEQDLAQARDLMKAAADAGLPLAQFNYGQMLIQASPAGGFEEARSYFEKAAKAGVGDAQYAMAQLYIYGRGVKKTDLAAAREWLKTAASNGYDTAQIEYGIWLVNGKGGPANAQEGFLWLKRAAERGNPIAINRVAHLYKDGIGTAADRGQAAMWSVLAKRADNTDPTLDDFFRGLDATAQKAALEAANRFRTS
ncbi:tetratricopeptide repeat protein [Mangrovicella endophytica]|uniref:tetratricopeptide repeat protein n=1 Tax=Mangrovicella endophytica TaxID=2066697 RepID=UPI000C9DDF19|nr:tetratricopeptide repeat protein [Mangrovicella endophytica]